MMSDSARSLRPTHQVRQHTILMGWNMGPELPQVKRGQALRGFDVDLHVGIKSTDILRPDYYPPACILDK